MLIKTERHCRPLHKDSVFNNIKTAVVPVLHYGIISTHIFGIHKITFFFFLWRCGPTRAVASSFFRFLDHTQRRTTVGRTLLDEWSVRRRDLYLKTHNTRNRQTSMSPVGFEPTISASERPQTYALDRAATGTGIPSTVCTVSLFSLTQCKNSFPTRSV